MGRPRDEEVRKHFKELGEGRVKCNECGHSFSAGGGSTRMNAHINQLKGHGVRPCSAKRKQHDALEQDHSMSNQAGQIQANAKDNESIQVGSFFVSNWDNEDLQVLQYVFDCLRPEDKVFISPLSYLTREDFITLKPEAYLDSLVIDIFVEILTNIEREKKKAMASNWYLPVTFSNAALKGSVGSFLNFVHGQKMRENYMSNLESCEKIFIPVHIGARPNGGHFYLYIIHLKNEEIEILDSISDPFVSETERDETTKKLLLAMEKLFEEVTFTKFRSKKANNILLQPNEYDCGIFVINYMQQLDNYVKRNDSLQLQFDSKKEREHLALKLLNSDMNQEKQNLYDKARWHYANKRLRVDTSKEFFEKGSSEGLLLPTTYLIGVEEYTEQIWEWIKDDQVSAIGVWGMGGSGKTAIATHIYEKLLEDQASGGRKVIWVTVSQNSVSHLQKVIAKSIELDISDEFEVKLIGRRLLQAFKEMKECGVIILDDVWDHFFLKEVGFPMSGNRIKLIVTTRIREVCQGLGCKKNTIEVTPLDKEESWDLFEKFAEFQKGFSSKIKRIARNIADECGGLPLAIVRIATSMKGKEDAREWSHMLDSLQNMGTGQYEVDKWVLPVLRCSYDFLNDKLQRFFLYCALSRSGHYGVYFQGRDADRVIRIFVYESIYDNKKLKVQENEGYNMLDILHNHGMLERFEDDNGGDIGWRINKFFRVLAIGIAEETDTIMANAYKGLKEIPSEDQWKEDLTKVFLTGNKIHTIPDGTCPRCSHLSTLLLDGNENLDYISNDFFNNMPVLKILDISRTSIKRLPESVSNLKCLIILLLSGCKDLSNINIPSLVKLRRLISLDLSYTAITEAPMGLDSLVNLRCLNLLGTKIKPEMPAWPISKLMNLECLMLGREVYLMENVLMQDIKGLAGKLTVIVACFRDISIFNAYVIFMDEQPALRRSYHLTLWDASVHHFYNERGDEIINKEYYCMRRISLVGMNLVNEKAELPGDMEELCIRNCRKGRGGRTTLCSVLSCSSNNNNNPLQIERLEIESYTEVEYLCCLCGSCSFCSSSQLVGSLSLSDLSELKDLVSSADGVVDVRLPHSSLLSHVTDLTIWGCNSMERVMRPKLLPLLPNLRSLSVAYCVKMKEIVGEDEDGSDEMEVTITLPNLTSLELSSMPEFKDLVQGGGALMRCPSLHTFSADRCSQLKEPIQIEISNGCLLQIEKNSDGDYEWQNN